MLNSHWLHFSWIEFVWCCDLMCLQKRICQSNLCFQKVFQISKQTYSRGHSFSFCNCNFRSYTRIFYHSNVCFDEHVILLRSVHWRDNSFPNIRKLSRPPFRDDSAYVVRANSWRKKILSYVINLNLDLHKIHLQIN